jgi:hypothetical protein
MTVCHALARARCGFAARFYIVNLKIYVCSARPSFRPNFCNLAYQLICPKPTSFVRILSNIHVNACSQIVQLDGYPSHKQSEPIFSMNGA